MRSSEMGFTEARDANGGDDCALRLRAGHGVTVEHGTTAREKREFTSP